MRIPMIAIVLLLASQPAAIGQTAASTTPGACAALQQLQVPGITLTVMKTEWVAAGTTPPAGPAQRPPPRPCPHTAVSTA